MDILTPEQRRLNMSRIRGRNTKPEMLVRSALHRRGFRFRLHRRALPGTPDIVLQKYHAVIFVHGCFWHGHGCHLSKIPQTRTAFWTKKIGGNQARDRRAIARLVSSGWKVILIWECLLKGPRKRSLNTLIDQATAAVRRKAIACTDLSRNKLSSKSA